MGNTSQGEWDQSRVDRICGVLCHVQRELPVLSLSWQVAVKVALDWSEDLMTACRVLQQHLSEVTQLTLQAASCLADLQDSWLVEAVSTSSSARTVFVLSEPRAPENGITHIYNVNISHVFFVFQRSWGVLGWHVLPCSCPLALKGRSWPRATRRLLGAAPPCRPSAHVISVLATKPTVQAASTLFWSVWLAVGQETAVTSLSARKVIPLKYIPHTLIALLHRSSCTVGGRYFIDLEVIIPPAWGFPLLNRKKESCWLDGKC